MWPFKKKTVEQHLFGVTKIKIKGVTFCIKRIDAMDHLTGLNVLQKIYYTYKVNAKSEQNNAETLENLKKIKDYCRDILLAGVVYPKLSATADGEGLFVDKLFMDFALAQKLTESIIMHTYKKKIR